MGQENVSGKVTSRLLDWEKLKTVLVLQESHLHEILISLVMLSTQRVRETVKRREKASSMMLAEG